MDTKGKLLIKSTMKVKWPRELLAAKITYMCKSINPILIQVYPRKRG